MLRNALGVSGAAENVVACFSHFSFPSQSAGVGAVIDGPCSMPVGRTKKKVTDPAVKAATCSVNRIENPTSTPVTRENSSGHTDLFISNECEVRGCLLPSGDRRSSPEN